MWERCGSVEAVRLNHLELQTKRQKERFGSRCLSSGRAFLACGSKGARLGIFSADTA
jgi:hypothetical protein